MVSTDIKEQWKHYQPEQSRVGQMETRLRVYKYKAITKPVSFKTTKEVMKDAVVSGGHCAEAWVLCQRVCTMTGYSRDMCSAPLMGSL